MASLPFHATSASAASSASFLPRRHHRRFHFLRSQLPLSIPGAPSSRAFQLSCPARHRFLCCGGSSAVEEVRAGAVGQGRVRIRVRLDHQVKFGESVVVVGSVQALGSWRKDVPLAWTENGWVAELELGGGEVVEYKFVILSDGGKRKVWEVGENRVLKLPMAGVFDMVCRWNKTGEGVDLVGTAPGELIGKVEEEGDDSGDAEGGNGSVEDVEQSPFVEQWQGRAASFMRSNEHRSREIERTWITDGMEGVPLKLVEGDRNGRNWWRKVKSRETSNGMIGILFSSSREI
ncbi:hypothetical protein Taro_028753 [Colocasia esculenta]|uniref:CBM20 domain-containing protein n=1 Tax=Colocasia esculenta TaxID=4460 RepID=A0A843VC42_COLES|nr:hypothetical protein [Colocasia esculenta]